MNKNTYYEVKKTQLDEVSAEFVYSKEAENWALDLERRGFSTAIYVVERDAAVDHTQNKKA